MTRSIFEYLYLVNKFGSDNFKNYSFASTMKKTID